MKKILLFGLLIMAFTFKMYAQSDFSVFNMEGDKFWLIVNGIKQNENAETNVKVTGLNAPNYKIRVIFENSNLPAIDKSIFTKDVDGNYVSANYQIKKDKQGNYVLRLSSYDEVAAAPPAQYSAPLLLVERPTVTKTTQTTTTVSSGVSSDVTTGSVSADGGSMSINAVDPVTGERINVSMSINGVPAGVSGTSSTTTTTTTTTTTSSSSGIDTPPVNHHPASDHYIMQGYNGPMGCPWPMSEADFQSAKGSISSKDFEDSKLTIAKQILGSNCMLCAQVRDIMNLFSFEATRLDFAKFAYNRVFDQGNYYKLNDAFTFESSIDELNEYINKK